MSSPTDSIQDLDTTSKKRGRAQSVEPPTAPKDEDKPYKTTTTPKKTKREKDTTNNASSKSHSVSTIHTYAKDMPTTDKSTSTTLDDKEGRMDTQCFKTSSSPPEKDIPTGLTTQKDDEPDKKVHKKAPFEDSDRGGLAKNKASSACRNETASQYTFGRSSGFGTGGWASTISIHKSSLLPGSGFGSFSSSSSTTSIFANTLSSLSKVTSPPSNSDDTPQHIGDTKPTLGSKSKPEIKPTQVQTGEEDEKTVYQTKAKLLVLDAAQWKERGSGTFRLNVKKPSQARMVMRTDSVYRLILNLLLFPDLKVFIMQERFVRFAGFESVVKQNGSSEMKLVNYALKLPNNLLAKDLYHHISSRIPSH